jgi:superfamily II DNA helicase RecQ
MNPFTKFSIENFKELVDELGRIKGLPRHLPAREGQRILVAIQEGLGSPVPSKPTSAAGRRPDEAMVDRYEALRQWRNGQARARGVEPDVILSNRVLHLLAGHNPTSLDRLRAIEGLNQWERQEYGREIVRVLREHRRATANRATRPWLTEQREETDERV